VLFSRGEVLGDFAFTRVLLTTTNIEHLSNLFALENYFVFVTILITFSQLGYFEI
jgi:hypothetical protein